MSLRCLMILGNKNEPIWAFDPNNPEPRPKDCLGFADDEWKNAPGNSNLSFELEMKLHATLDRLEELLGSKANTLPRWQRSSNWVGSLGCVEDAEVYCYVSASNNKVLAMVECSDIIVVKKRRETEIKILLADVYNCFIQHTMNPFTAIRGHIQPPCTKFNDGIDKSITKYIESVATRQAKN